MCGIDNSMNKLKNILLIISFIPIFYFVSTGFYEAQMNEVLEDGTYSIPRYLFWLPDLDLAGLKIYFIIMSILGGVALPLLPIGFYYLIKDGWSNLKFQIARGMEIKQRFKNNKD